MDCCRVAGRREARVPNKQFAQVTSLGRPLWTPPAGAGQGRAGQGRAGQGRAGQGRAGQGRAAGSRAGRPDDHNGGGFGVRIITG